jgi:molecular chaperone GrpE
MSDDQQTFSQPSENVEHLHEQIAKLQQQLAEHTDGWKRAKADYLNLKKQTDKEKQELFHYAQGAAVIEFLPIYDNLKRAIKHIPADQLELDWVKGLTHILRQFEEALKAMNITIVTTEGETFDHTKHHAISKVKKDGVATDTIIEEVKTGFMAGDRVLEPAQVVVAE